MKGAYLYNFGCKSRQFLAFFAMHLAQNQLAIFNIDRFLALIRYQCYTNNFMHNKRYCTLWFLANVVLSALVNLPFLFLFAIDPDTQKCSVQSPEEMSLLNLIMLSVWAIFYIAVLMLIIIPTNFYISFKLRWVL